MRHPLSPDHLHHQSLLQHLKVLAHDDLVVVVLLDDELEAQLFDVEKLEVRGIMQCVQNVDVVDTSVQVLHAQLLQPFHMELTKQQDTNDDQFSKECRTYMQ